MIKKKIKTLKKLINFYNLDGYIIPKNDAYFSEFSSPNRLKTISNFSGSAGFAIILKKENFLFVDGRYTIQAQNESGKHYKIIEIPKIAIIAFGKICPLNSEVKSNQLPVFKIAISISSIFITFPVISKNVSLIKLEKTNGKQIINLNLRFLIRKKK